MPSHKKILRLLRLPLLFAYLFNSTGVYANDREIQDNADAVQPDTASQSLNDELAGQSIATIDSYLEAIESPFHDLVAGTEKVIRWHTEKEQTEYSIIYLHGFSASRREIDPVPQLLADQLGANIYYARLKGHGRTDDAMADASVSAWLADTEFAYAVGSLIGKKVILLSTSTGGTLATWLSSQRSADNIVANIMISPNFGIKNRTGEIVRWGWGLQLAKWVNGPYRSFEPANEMHDKYWTQRYPMEALVPVIELVDQVLEMDKTSISTPQLIIYSPNDQVISVDRILEVSKQPTASPITLEAYTESTDQSQHVLAGDACSPASNESMVRLISNYLDSIGIKQLSTTEYENL